MHSFLLSALIALSSATPPPSTAAAVPGVPPPFALQDLDGNTVTLESFKGFSPVLIVFYRGYW
jgi:cytochrome oxidase Cu insertion factor (SCO1/SenC/PrrC family)